MTYIKWQDELEGYLGNLSREEKEKVFAYFAEMYADKRDAGISEKEIIEEFGAPYDVAKRILAENGDDGESADQSPHDTDEGYTRLRNGYKTSANGTPKNGNYGQSSGYAQSGGSNRRGDYTWVFVLLCVIFAVPLFGLIMGMVGITVGFCVAPIAVIGGGFAAVGAAIGGAVAGGGAAVAAAMAGLGLIIVGVGLILAPLCFGLVKLMWKAFTKLFGALHKAFSGRA